MQFYLPFLNEFGNRVWECKWVANNGELWKYRNNFIFKNGEVDHVEIFTVIQLKVWS